MPCSSQGSGKTLAQVPIKQLVIQVNSLVATEAAVNWSAGRWKVAANSASFLPKEFYPLSV